MLGLVQSCLQASVFALSGSEFLAHLLQALLESLLALRMAGLSIEGRKGSGHIEPQGGGHSRQLKMTHTRI